MKNLSLISILAVSLVGLKLGYAQGPEPRAHTNIRSNEVRLQSAYVAPIAATQVVITVEGQNRIVRANGIADHETGQFPGRGNPHGIRVQKFQFSLPLSPQKKTNPQYYTLGIFGIGVNGVLFDPQAAEWYRGDRGSIWQYDPLGGALALGLDEHHAHVQPNGAYHYHGLPTGLLRNLGFSSDRHSPLVGWAMDGFPIYALTGQVGGRLLKAKSSYRLKSGSRPGGTAPPGQYDGAFVADWEYIEGLGNLDECNGTVTVSDEFPEGTYAYFLTETFPVVPRCFMGSPVVNGPGRASGMQRGAGRPDLKAAAERLGIDMQKLRRALGPPPPDLGATARKLGITEDELRHALHPR